MRRIHLALVTSLFVACTPTDPVQERLPLAVEPEPLYFAVYDLTAQWWDELRAKEERRKIREFQRSLGKRVCEEGEWPQRWGEDGCRVCGCDEGVVRRCTMERCHNRGSGRTKKQPR